MNENGEIKPENRYSKKEIQKGRFIFLGVALFYAFFLLGDLVLIGLNRNDPAFLLYSDNMELDIIKKTIKLIMISVFLVQMYKGQLWARLTIYVLLISSFPGGVLVLFFPSSELPPYFKLLLSISMVILLGILVLFLKNKYIKTFLEYKGKVIKGVSVSIEKKD